MNRIATICFIMALCAIIWFGEHWGASGHKQASTGILASVKGLIHDNTFNTEISMLSYCNDVLRHDAVKWQVRRG